MNYHLKNVCRRTGAATSPVPAGLFLLGRPRINRAHTRPYKLPRGRPEAAQLLEGEPYQEWQWASSLPASSSGPEACHPGSAWDTRAACSVLKVGALCLVWCKPGTDSSKPKGSAVHAWDRNSLGPTHPLPLTQAPKPRAKAPGPQGPLSCLQNFTGSCLPLFLTGSPLPVPEY